MTAIDNPYPSRPFPQLVLASGSTYRKGLLAKLGLSFEAASPDIDESPRRGETPEALALRLAIEKAEALSDRYSQHLIIGSDQVADLAGRRLEKPGTQFRAAEQLRAASGNSVRFVTAVCVLDSASGKMLSDVDVTTVRFRKLSEMQIVRYLEREPALDCAGSFKSEGLGITLIERMETEDPNALVGLPLIRLTGLLRSFDLALP
jgi:septum formation protein